MPLSKDVYTWTGGWTNYCLHFFSSLVFTDCLSPIFFLGQHGMYRFRNFLLKFFFQQLQFCSWGGGEGLVDVSYIIFRKKINSRHLVKTLFSSLLGNRVTLMYFCDKIISRMISKYHSLMTLLLLSLSLHPL